MDFKVFLSTLPDFAGIRKYSKRTNILCGVECDGLIQMKFLELKKDLPNLINELEFEKAFLIVLRTFDKSITLSKVRKEDNFEKAKFLFWIYDELEKISKMEMQYLSGSTSKRLRNAGIERLNVFEYFNTIDSISKEYGYKHEEVENMRYSRIFDIQYRNKILGEIHENILNDSRSV